MKRGLKFKLAGILALPVLMISFQNCGSGKIAFDGSGAASTQKENAPFTCSGHALGSAWVQATDGVSAVPQSCQFGGDLTYVYKVDVPMTCSEVGAVATGTAVNGDLASTAGSCNPPVCGSHADASAWQVQTGTVQKQKLCPDSAVMIIQDYQKLSQYKCESGNSVVTGTTTGDYIADESKCPAAMLSASFSSPKVVVDTTVKLNIVTSTVASVSYSCSNGQSGSVPIGNATVAVKVTQDVTCEVKALTSLNTMLTASAQVMVTCDADQNYVNGMCVDKFACNSFVEVTGSSLQIPARSAAGVCYYKKLYDALSYAKSSGARDANVVSRDHDDNNGTSHPYIMGTGPIDFTLAGARNLKLSGKGTSLAPILVDNYVLIGSRAMTSSSTAKDNSWKAYGTADSTIQGTNYVQAYGTNVALTPFASGGTATVRPILFDDFFVMSKSYVLDVRALDCGGSRQLSDIYLIFQ